MENGTPFKFRMPAPDDRETMADRDWDQRLFMHGDITMKKFLAVYTGTLEAVEASGWNALGENERRAREKAGIGAWRQWLDDNRERIADTGAPVGKTKHIGPKGIADARNDICAYVVVEAESHEAAAKLFENHPHFTIMPGTAVEVMECLPLPGA